MKFLVTGSSGMLGSVFCRQLIEKNSVYGIDIKPFSGSLKLSGFAATDITDSGAVNDFIGKIRPDVVIHTAAYTDVDGCEVNAKKAFSINAEGTKNLAQASLAAGSKIVYISTDYIFDGFKKTPYTELDVPNPINVYGKVKLKGEKYVKSICPDFLIVRSSGLYGKNGKNFVDTILSAARSGKDLKIVNDQYTCTTNVIDLAMAVGELVKRGKKGTYHIANSGTCSWYEFGNEILSISKIKKDIIAIKSEEIGRAAKRPVMSALDCSKYTNVVGKSMRIWKEALKEYLSLVTVRDSG